MFLFKIGVLLTEFPYTDSENT